MVRRWMVMDIWMVIDCNTSPAKLPLLAVHYLQGYLYMQQCHSDLPLREIFLGRISFFGSCTILPHVFLRRMFVLLKLLHLRHVQHFRDIVRLPFLEWKSKTFMRVVLLICLILVVFDLDKVRVDRRRVEGEGNETGHTRSFGDKAKSPGLQSFEWGNIIDFEHRLDYLVVFELNEVSLVLNNFISIVDACAEQLGEGEPLAVIPLLNAASRLLKETTYAAIL